MTEPSPNAVSSPAWTEGQRIGGKFRVERVIGEGGMGVVVAATHIELDERVAIKFLRMDLAADADLVARFTQEARDAVKLKSEYVARTFDVGVEAGTPYIVMEYLEGHDLGRELELKGTLPIDIAAEYLIQACAGVAAAHSRGIVHRDIKPENLFLAERGDGSSIVKILDFGISKAVLSGDASRAPILGSPFYMSPEQLQGGEIDFRSDIWSLGAVLFELLAGVHAFDTDQPLGRLVKAVQKDPPRKLADYRPMAPEELQHVIDRCLEKEPTKRIQSAAELSIALLRFAPKRARVPAERASSVTRAAGLSSEANLTLPPSTAPPSTDVARYSAPAIPPSARLPAPASAASPGIRSVTPGALETPSVAAAAFEDGNPNRGKKRAMIILLGVALAAVLLGVFAFTRSGPVSNVEVGPPPSSTGATATVPVATLPGVPVASGDPASAAPSSSTSGDTPVADAQTGARPVLRPAVPPYNYNGRRNPGPTTTPSTAPAPPSRSDLDIRMQR